MYGREQSYQQYPMGGGEEEYPDLSLSPDWLSETRRESLAPFHTMTPMPQYTPSGGLATSCSQMAGQMERLGAQMHSFERKMDQWSADTETESSSGFSNLDWKDLLIIFLVILLLLVAGVWVVKKLATPRESRTTVVERRVVD